MTDPKEDLTEELKFLLRRDAATRMTGTIASDLYSSARTASRRALRSLISSGGDQRDAALQAGMALEYMAKWYLAEIHPVLIVKGEDFPSLLLMTGNGHLLAGEARLRVAKTITGPLACERVAQLLGAKWNYSKGKHEVVFHARNAVVHLGLQEDDHVTRQGLAIMVHLVDGLRQLRSDADDYHEFWGESAHLASVLLGEEINRIRLRLEGLIAEARDLFAKRVPPELEGTARAAVLAAISGRGLGSVDEYISLSCPACGQSGRYLFDVEAGEVFQVNEGDGEVLMQVMDPVYLGFECSACDLDLDYEEAELAFPGQKVELNAEYLGRVHEGEDDNTDEYLDDEDH